MVRLASLKLVLVVTFNTSTVSLPLKLTLWPTPSSVKFLVILSVELRIIVPLQLKLTVSPEAALLIAVRKLVSLQVATVKVAAFTDGVIGSHIPRPTRAITNAINRQSFRLLRAPVRFGADCVACIAGLESILPPKVGMAI